MSHSRFDTRIHDSVRSAGAFAVAAMRVTRNFCGVSIAAGLVAGSVQTAFGAGYPVKPVRIVVGFAPVGGADVVTRILSQKLTAGLGQTVIVDNRPGAGGSIGAALVAASAPDGYTLLGVSSSYAVIPILYKNLPFDPVKDLVPVALIAEAPLLLVVHPSLPLHSVGELITYARTKPDQLNFASGGEGTSGFLAGELFKRLAGVNIIHVPYKGAGPALVDVIAGQVQMTFSSMLASLPHVKSGALRALAVTSTQRSPVLPQLPTVAEAGVNGYSRTTWYGVLAPARTPASIVARLNAEIVAAVNSSEVESKLMTDGARPKAGTPQQFHDYLLTEIALARQIIQKAGVPQ